MNSNLNTKSSGAENTGSTSDQKEAEFQMAAQNDTTTPLKRCSKCGNEYPATLEYFYKHPLGKYGLQYYCKACTGEDSKRRAKKYPEKVREGQARRVNNHPDKTREYARRYRERHREKTRESEARYRKEHQKQVCEWRARWAKEHPEKVNESNRRHRARKHNLPVAFTTTQAVAALDYWKRRCAFCGIQLNQLSMFEDIQTHMDHFIPLSDKRPDNPGTVVGNMLPSCADCNRHKNGLDPIEWITGKFGKRKAKRVIERIEAYFEWVRQPK
jgi:hypothetical protein